MGMNLLAVLRERRRPVMILLALLTTFAGADLVLNRPKDSAL